MQAACDVCVCVLVYVWSAWKNCLWMKRKKQVKSKMASSWHYCMVHLHSGIICFMARRGPKLVHILALIVFGKVVAVFCSFCCCCCSSSCNFIGLPLLLFCAHKLESCEYRAIIKKQKQKKRHECDIMWSWFHFLYTITKTWKNATNTQAAMCIFTFHENEE